MLEEKRLFEIAKNKCNETFKEISWYNSLENLRKISCPDCGSSLIYQQNAENDEPTDAEGVCYACDRQFDPAETIEIIVSAECGDEDFVTFKDSGQSVIYQCPECASSTYIQGEKGVGCFLCRHEVSGECARCNEPLDINNVSIFNPSFCDWCDHMMNKDD